MPVFRNQIGINLTETKLQLVEIRYKNDAFYLENVDQLILKDSISPELNESKLTAILQDSFTKLNQKNNLTSIYYSFCLPNNFFKIFEIPYDTTLTKKDLVDHLRWELSILYPHIDEENYLIQFVEVNKTSVRIQNRAIIFALDKNIVNSINNFCKSNNLELKYIDNAHLASNAFLHLSKAFEKNEITLSIYIDQSSSSIAVIEGVTPFFFKVLNEGGLNIIDQLQMLIKQLEDLNIGINSISKIILSGQNVTDEFLSKISTVLNSSIIKINPFERLRIDEKLNVNRLVTSQFNSFTAATGIAIRII